MVYFGLSKHGMIGSRLTGIKFPGTAKEKLAWRVRQWLQTTCYVTGEGKVFLSDLYVNYTEHCEENGLVACSKKMFSILLMSELSDYIQDGSVSRTVNGKVRFHGIDIRTNKVPNILV